MQEQDFFIFSYIFCCFIVNRIECSVNYTDKRNSIVIQQVTEPFEWGETPHWDNKRNAVFMVDVSTASVVKYDYASGKVNIAKIAGAKSIGFIIPVKDKADQFVVGMKHSIAVITWDGVSPTVPKEKINILFTVEKDKPINVFNDGKAGPCGRVFAGTRSSPDPSAKKEANLFRFGISRKLDIAYGPIGVGNGLTWTADVKTFYYTDSNEFNIFAFDFDKSTGDISNKRVVFDLKKYNISGIADGMTIDRNQNLWIANYGGGQILHVNPRDGTLIEKLLMPAKGVTAVAFVGPNLDELFVTSLSKILKPEEKNVIPNAGAAFIVKGIGVQGYNPYVADIYAPK